MRSKWQSSLTYGNSVKSGLKGNRHGGDAEVPDWENLLDLWRSLYSFNDHSLYILCSQQKKAGLIYERLD